MSPPTVGRIVHYVSRGSADGVFPPECRAAVVTQAGAWVDVETRGPVEESGRLYREVAQRWDPEATWLNVMNPTGTFTYGPHVYDGGSLDEGTNPPVPQRLLCDGQAHAAGSWHWPHLGGTT